MTKQILIIHGGNTFETYEEYLDYLKNREYSLERLNQKDWKRNLQAELGDGYQVINPQMPNGWNARYAEWKIWFERLLPLLDGELALVGHSLGGIFLAKYLSENAIQKKIIATFLIAAPIGPDENESLTDFVLGDDLSGLERQGGSIFIYQSRDDVVVPYRHAEDYAKKLPKAIIRMFDDRKHFNVESLPELAADIRERFEHAPVSFIE